MKTFLTICIVCSALLNGYAQEKTEILEIKTTGLDSKDFLSQGKQTFIKYIVEQIPADKLFKLKILDADDATTVEVVKSPKSAVHRLVIEERELAIHLQKDETVDYEITIVKTSKAPDSTDAEEPAAPAAVTDSTDADNVGTPVATPSSTTTAPEETKTIQTTYKYFISISTDAAFKPNANFIFLSAIRSVAGTAQSSEFFDINLKFNYGDNWFTLFGLDLSLSPAETDTSQMRINEGMASVNQFVNSGEKLRSGFLNRAFFYGAGLKVFNRQPYLGVHAGSLEINGPLFSSYLILGYYRNAYGGNALWTGKAREYPVLFRNNFYSECTLAFDNKKDVAGILSDIRIKLGILAPFTNSDDDQWKPDWKDVQYRLVLEVPIGGIFKFGGEHHDFEDEKKGLFGKKKGKKKGVTNTK